MPVSANVGGSWKNQKSRWVNVGGTWKEVVNTWVNVSGSWKKAYTYSYATSNWGACSKNCGTGTQTRTVTCKRSDGTTVTDSYCTAYGLTKPGTSQNCNTTACYAGGAFYSTSTFTAPHAGSYTFYLDGGGGGGGGGGQTRINISCYWEASESSGYNYLYNIRGGGGGGGGGGYGSNTTVWLSAGQQVTMSVGGGGAGGGVAGGGGRGGTTSVSGGASSSAAGGYGGGAGATCPQHVGACAYSSAKPSCTAAGGVGGAGGVAGSAGHAAPTATYDVSGGNGGAATCPGGRGGNSNAAGSWGSGGRVYVAYNG